MADAYIVGAIRTATGRKKGRLSGIHPVDMGAIVVDELIEQKVKIRFFGDYSNFGTKTFD